MYVTESEYHEWLQCIFGHPDSDANEATWQLNVEGDKWQGDGETTIACLQRTFERANVDLSAFSDAQVARGLTYLIDPGQSDFAFFMLHHQACWEARKNALHAIYDLFEGYYALRCDDILSHTIRHRYPNQLNGICYMWWDIFPAHGLAYHNPSDEESTAIDSILLGVMGRILDLDAIACQESALHGLNHWRQYYPAVVRRYIDRFLGVRRPESEALRRYALDVRDWYVM